MCVSLPLLLRLHKKVGNSSKITRALSLVKLVLPWFKKTGKENFRLLVDAWYMKKTFILYALKLGINVVGQVRKDTALFLHPIKNNQLPKKKVLIKNMEQNSQQMSLTNYRFIKSISIFMAAVNKFLTVLPVASLDF